jgi:hypothetical protein
MFANIFEQRDKKVSLLIKLGDCIGRSLRENVSLFSVDGEEGKVTYLTQSEKVITGNFNIDEDVRLVNIRVQDASIFHDTERFDALVSEKVNDFISDIHESELGNAERSFSNILGLWEQRVKLDSFQAKIFEKCERLKDIEEIVESESFQNLTEIRPQLIEFLKENKEKISTVPEIKNAVNLSNTVSRAFDFPRLTIEALQEGGSYILKDGLNDSIYEMICRQELVKKELLESKKNFSVTWAHNTSIQNLASCIFESDEKIVAALGEALRDVPYLALASKKSLTETFTNCLGSADGIGIKESDIQKFSSNIFEIKKEAKELFINAINEKYGVNIQNIQEPASFKSLVNTQIVIFEALSRLAPKGSVLKQILTENAGNLKNKSGVQCIDVNDYIYDLFIEAGYEDSLEENSTLSKYSKADFKRVATDLDYEESLNSSLSEKVDHSKKDSNYESDENIDELPDDGKDADTAVATEEPEPAADPVASDKEDPTPEAPAPTQSKEDVVDSMADLDEVMDIITNELSDSDGESEDAEEDKEKE